MRLDSGGLVHLVVQLHVLDDEFNQRPRVALVIDGEVVLIANALSIDAQQSGKDRVEGPHP